MVKMILSVQLRGCFFSDQFIQAALPGFYWKNINAASLKTDLLLLPALCWDSGQGIKLVAKKDEGYRRWYYCSHFAGAIVIFLK